MADPEGPLRRLLKELRERRVIRAAVVYAVVAWVMVQVADTFFPALRLPEWSVTLVAALAVLGFPVTVVLAWVFDVSSGGVRHSKPVSLPSFGPWGYGLSGAVLVGVSGLAFHLFVPAPQAPSGTPVRDASIAVLPFADMSAAGNQRHLSDGITEDILTRLAQVSDLHVTSRTSVMRYRDTDRSIRDIGRELGVSAILEGSVRREGDRLRITAQLIDAATDAHLWAESYDRSASDVFAIQSEIAEEIVASLQVTLSPEEEEGLRMAATESVEAYDLYLRGRERLYQPYASTEELRRLSEAALVLFEEALRADPEYAPAYAGMAHAILWFPPSEEWEDGRRADTVAVLARRAIRLQPRLSSGYVALGRAYLADPSGSRDAARDQFLLALELNPNDADALTALGRVEELEGRLVQAVEYHRRAAEENPEDPEPLLWLGFLYTALDLPDRAAASFRNALEDVVSHPARLQCHLAQVDLSQGRFESAGERVPRMLEHEEDAFVHSCAHEVYLQVGDHERALEHARLAADLDVGNPEADDDGRLWTAEVRALTGDTTGFGEILRTEEAETQELLAEDPGAADPHVTLAWIAAHRDDGAEAARHLDEAYDLGYRRWIFTRNDPAWARVRDHDAFREVVERILADVSRQRSEVIARGL